MNPRKEDVLLTVAVPTYNRMECLDLCLSQLCPQAARFPDRVEVIVSDNCSPDGTGEVVRRYAAAGARIRYVRNDENIGADRNIARCLAMASGKYLLVLGDDDVLLDGALERLLAILEGEYGVVHLRSYSFLRDFRAERPRKEPTGRTFVYGDRIAFADKVNAMLTFLSGNVVNRSLLDPDFRPDDFLDTHLVQVSWTIAAILASERNAWADEYFVAARAENSGGYRLCNVFGVNLNRIFRAFEERGADPALFRAIFGRMLKSFFPNYIVTLRKGGTGFRDEDYYRTLRPVFGSYAAFWLMVYPAIAWPVPLAEAWLKVCKNGMKIAGLANRRKPNGIR